MLGREKVELRKQTDEYEDNQRIAQTEPERRNVVAEIVAFGGFFHRRQPIDRIAAKHMYAKQNDDGTTYDLYPKLMRIDEIGNKTHAESDYRGV